MAIRAVFFDAAGTLIKPVRPVGESYAFFARNHRIAASPSELTERFRLCFNSAPPLAFPGAAAADIDSLEREWWRRLVKRIFEPWGDLPQLDDYFSELFAYFAQPEAWTFYPEVPEVLSALKQRGLILDVISNFDSRLLNILEGLNVARWFHHIFISSRVGHAKPDRQIFDAALRRHAIDAASAIHVGDSQVTDFRGAQDAGLKGLLVDRSAQSHAASTSRIATLTEIIPLVEKFDHSGQ